MQVHRSLTAVICLALCSSFVVLANTGYTYDDNGNRITDNQYDSNGNRYNDNNNNNNDNNSNDYYNNNNGNSNRNGRNSNNNYNGNGITNGQSYNSTLSIPACFSDCAQTAANAIGCNGLSDTSCFCTRQAFFTASSRCNRVSCPDLANDSSQTQRSYSALETRCKQAIGDKYNLHLPTDAELNGTSDAASPSLQSISACLILSVLAASFSLLFM